MKFIFEWDENKAERNVQKHAVSFQEAATVFRDELSVTFSDETHSTDEERFIDIGRSANGQVLIVVYTERKDVIRIISCRKATRAERKTYENQTD